MKTQNYLRKQAIVEHLVTPAAMHVLQNATANHALLTIKGGIEIGKHLIGKNKTLGNVVHGVGRGAIPEKAILEAKYILGFNVKNYHFIDKEFERIESRRADIVLKVENEYILHIEVQSSYEAKMPYRMLRYYLDIKELFDLPVKQYLVNLSNVNMKCSLKEFNYSYEVVNMKNIDCDNFLNSNSPDALVLAVLCDFKNYEASIVVEKILRKLKKLIKDDKTYRKYFIMLEEISTLRNLKEVIKEVNMRLSDIRWEDLPSYEIGMQKGIQKGLEKGVISLYKYVKDIDLISKEFNLEKTKVIYILDKYGIRVKK